MADPRIVLDCREDRDSERVLLARPSGEDSKTSSQDMNSSNGIPFNRPLEFPSIADSVGYDTTSTVPDSVGHRDSSTPPVKDGPSSISNLNIVSQRLAASPKRTQGVLSTVSQGPSSGVSHGLSSGVSPGLQTGTSQAGSHGIRMFPEGVSPGVGPQRGVSRDISPIEMTNTVIKLGQEAAKLQAMEGGFVRSNSATEECIGNASVNITKSISSPQYAPNNQPQHIGRVGSVASSFNMADRVNTNDGIVTDSASSLQSGVNVQNDIQKGVAIVPNDAGDIVPNTHIGAVNGVSPAGSTSSPLFRNVADKSPSSSLRKIASLLPIEESQMNLPESDIPSNSVVLDSPCGFLVSTGKHHYKNTTTQSSTKFRMNSSTRSQLNPTHPVNSQRGDELDSQSQKPLSPSRKLPITRADFRTSMQRSYQFDGTQRSARKGPVIVGKHNQDLHASGVLHTTMGSATSVHAQRQDLLRVMDKITQSFEDRYGNNSYKENPQFKLGMSSASHMQAYLGGKLAQIHSAYCPPIFFEKSQEIQPQLKHRSTHPRNPFFNDPISQAVWGTKCPATEKKTYEDLPIEQRTLLSTKLLHSALEPEKEAAVQSVFFNPPKRNRQVGVHQNGKGRDHKEQDTNGFNAKEQATFYEEKVIASAPCSPDLKAANSELPFDKHCVLGRVQSHIESMSNMVKSPKNNHDFLFSVKSVTSPQREDFNQFCYVKGHGLNEGTNVIQGTKTNGSTNAESWSFAVKSEASHGAKSDISRLHDMTPHGSIIALSSIKNSPKALSLVSGTSFDRSVISDTQTPTSTAQHRLFPGKQNALQELREKALKQRDTSEAPKQSDGKLSLSKDGKPFAAKSGNQGKPRASDSKSGNQMQNTTGSRLVLSPSDVKKILDMVSDRGGPSRKSESDNTEGLQKKRESNTRKLVRQHGDAVTIEASRAIEIEKAVEGRTMGSTNSVEATTKTEAVIPGNHSLNILESQILHELDIPSGIFRREVKTPKVSENKTVIVPDIMESVYVHTISRDNRNSVENAKVLGEPPSLARNAEELRLGTQRTVRDEPYFDGTDIRKKFAQYRTHLKASLNLSTALNQRRCGPRPAEREDSNLRQKRYGEDGVPNLDFPPDSALNHHVERLFPFGESSVKNYRYSTQKDTGNFHMRRYPATTKCPNATKYTNVTDAVDSMCHLIPGKKYSGTTLERTLAIHEFHSILDCKISEPVKKLSEFVRDVHLRNVRENRKFAAGTHGAPKVSEYSEFANTTERNRYAGVAHDASDVGMYAPCTTSGVAMQRAHNPPQKSNYATQRSHNTTQNATTHAIADALSDAARDPVRHNPYGTDKISFLRGNPGGSTGGRASNKRALVLRKTYESPCLLTRSCIKNSPLRSSSPLLTRRMF